MCRDPNAIDATTDTVFSGGRLDARCDCPIETAVARTVSPTLQLEEGLDDRMETSARVSQGTSTSLTRTMLNKVPEVTIFFWLIKILCTTVGETAADFLNDHLGLGLTGTSLVMGAALIVALYFQFK